MGREALISSMTNLPFDEKPVNVTSSEWLFQTPELFLWASRIIITEDAFYYLSEKAFEKANPSTQEAINIILNSFLREGIIKFVRPEKYFTEIIMGSIDELVTNDAMNYTQSGNVRVDDNEPIFFEVGELTIYPSMVQSYYADIMLSRFLGCTCISDAHQKAYLESRFSNTPIEQSSPGLNVFRDAYSILIPKINLHDDYKLFCDTNAVEKCKYGDEYRTDNASNAKSFVEDVLVQRGKPEIQGLSKVLDRIESEASGEDEINKMLFEDLRKEQSHLLNLYPNVRAAARITQGVSTAALALFGAQPEALFPASALVAGTIAEAFVQKAQEKNRWKITMLDNICA